jgi:2-iminoacetate synthase ThiH
MGRLWRLAVERAGLADVAERALAGRGLDAAGLARLRAADTLVLAGMADAVRERHRGDEVRMFPEEVARRDRSLVALEPSGGPGGAVGMEATGEEWLREVALARLGAAGSLSIGVRFDLLGIELAQVALVFGADAWWGDFGARRVLPLFGASERRGEIRGLFERIGRRPVWIDAPATAREERA